MDCPVCNDEAPKEHFEVKEMMLGIGDVHTYLMCASCGCLYLKTMPKDIQRYYPKDYYSFNRSIQKMSLMKRTFGALRDRGVLLKTPWRFLALLKPESNIIRMVSFATPKRTTKILDVGSGAGTKLEPFINAGIDVTGIDPFIEKDIERGKVKIRKKSLSEIQDEFDLIMFNHVFEHLEDPLGTLKQVAARLSSKGKCMIRIPVLPNDMWDKYKENWIQIDAPRHCFIHSLKSLQILAKAAGFKTIDIKYDSTPFQMMGSEYYRRGICMKDGDFRLNRNEYFSKEEIEFFKKESKRLNDEERGDQAAIILEKVN